MELGIPALGRLKLKACPEFEASWEKTEARRKKRKREKEERE